MSVPLSQLLSELPETTRNSTTGALDNTKRTRALNRILQEMQDYGDWEFTKRTNTFFFIDGVYEYSLENYLGATCQDNDGSTAILDFKNPYDLRPVNIADISLEYKEVRDVKAKIRRNRFNYEYGVENDTISIGFPRAVSAQLHNCDSLTANGTWAASSDATNLTIDTVIFAEGAGALNFDTSAGTSLVVTNSTLTSVNLETLKNKSHLTMKVDLPTITNFTSVRLRWGSSASDYYEKTETAPAANQTIVAGRNFFAFRWADATETGTPDDTAIDYLQVVITYSGSTTDTDFRIDDIRVGQETEMELEYYSLAMVQDSAGDYQLEFNADSVTQSDTLLGASKARRTLVSGGTYECFKIIGGKSERDRTDNFKEYQGFLIKLLQRVGHRVRRPSKTLNFPNRSKRGTSWRS